MQQREEVPAVRKLLHQHHLPVLLERAVQADDVSVLQLGVQLNLPGRGEEMNMGKVMGGRVLG